MIALPNHLHAPVAIQAMEAGKHVLVEKPIARNSAEALAMIEARDRTGKTLMVGMNQRFSPKRAALKQLIEEGELGDVYYAKAWWRRRRVGAGLWQRGNWFLTPELSGGDPLIDLGIHVLDLALHLMGFPEALSVDGSCFCRPLPNKACRACASWKRCTRAPRRANRFHCQVTYAEPSGVLLAGQSESGIACTIEMSPYRTTIDWQESALACFEHGYVQIELPAPLASNRPGRVEMLRDPGGDARPQTIVPQLPWVHAMRQQAINFCRAIRGETPPPNEALEALEDLVVAREYIRLWTGI
jgi:predicted dehydrogenase